MASLAALTAIVGINGCGATASSTASATPDTADIATLEPTAVPTPSPTPDPAIRLAASQYLAAEAPFLAAEQAFLASPTIANTKTIEIAATAYTTALATIKKEVPLALQADIAAVNHDATYEGVDATEVVLVNNPGSISQLTPAQAMTILVNAIPGRVPNVTRLRADLGLPPPAGATPAA